jgi:hypothetical protein
MREQLSHLVAMAGRTNVTVQVLPFSIGAHASPSGPFTVFELPEPYPTVAHVETRAGSIYLEADGAARFVHAYDWLQRNALPPDESLACIQERAKHLSHGVA